MFIPTCSKMPMISLFSSPVTVGASNYRPISTPSIFNKLFQKIIPTKLNECFIANNVLSNVQFNFRKMSNATFASVNQVPNLLQSFHDNLLRLPIF